MPIYEYRCQDCGSRFDALRPMREADAQIACTICNSLHTSRKLSVFAAQSGGKAIAGTQASGCSGCSSGSCAGCNPN
jgi:putative FmdB family regulatory protein